MHDAQSEEETGDFLSPRDEWFEKRLRKIVDAVETIQEEARASIPETRDEREEPAVCLFLADAADSLQTLRDRIADEARDQDAQVLDEIPPPLEAADHDGQVSAALARADLAVHLLDRWPGRRIVDCKQNTYPRAQLALSREAETDTLIWMPRGLVLEDIEDETWRCELDELVHRERAQGAYELVRGSQTELIELVREKIAARQEVGEAPDGENTFLVDTHQKDQRYAFALANVLAREGVEVEFNQESRDPDRSLALFEEKVPYVRNLIITSGRVVSSWCTGRIKKAVKIAAERFLNEDRFALEHIWLLLVPGCSDAIALPAIPPLFRVDLLDNRRSETIEPDNIVRMLAHDDEEGQQ